jgi:hypothetical protein
MLLGGWRTALAAGSLAAAALACDNDPSQPDVNFPTANLLSDTTTLGRQEGIRFFFPGGLQTASALDPANFVVTNQCNGLRVPGALRVGTGPAGDTLVFTPSQALPFLTRLGVRVQNLQAANGTQLAQPITATLVTEPPPVADASWSFLNSPTNDLVTGIDFAPNSLLVGYSLTTGGGLYRTDDGGRTYAAVYKNVDLSGTAGLEQFGTDSVFFVGGLRTGSTFGFGVFRSTNKGLTVDLVSNTDRTNLIAARFRSIGGVVRGALGGQLGGPRAFTYKSAGTTGGTMEPSAGIVADPTTIFGDISLSSDTTKAVLTAARNNTEGVAYRSVDGGHSYTPFTLPANAPGLRGAGFVSNTTALLLGDSSTIYRADVANGTVTALGAAAGIPQGSVDQVTGEVLTYTFLRARFDNAGQVGYVVGFFLRRRPGTPDQLGGIILRSADGGLTYTRQAIQGAPDNGLGFPAVIDVKVKASGLAALSGLNGLMAARQPNASSQVAVCSLTQP